MPYQLPSITVRDARFLHGRHLGQLRRARRVVVRKHAHASGLYVLEARRERDEQQLYCHLPISAAPEWPALL